jgi:hypothetical protein
MYSCTGADGDVEEVDVEKTPCHGACEDEDMHLERDLAAKESQMKIRKELCFGLTFMALVVTAAALLLLSGVPTHTLAC